MASTNVSMEIAAPADKVWQLIGGFNSLPDWLPYIPASELSEGGRVRSLANPSGEAIIERMEAFSEKERSYSYAILQAPFPVTGYLSTLRVRDGADGKSVVDWSGSFTSDGVSDDEVIKLFHGIYHDGLTALQRHFSG